MGRVKLPKRYMRETFAVTYANRNYTIVRKGYIFSSGRAHIEVIEDVHVKEGHPHTCVVTPKWYTSVKEAINDLLTDIKMDGLTPVSKTKYLRKLNIDLGDEDD